MEDEMENLAETNATLDQTFVNKFLQSKLFVKLKDFGVETIEHTACTILALISIAIIHFAIEKLLGKDATFYGSLRVDYVVDTAHLVVFLTLITGLVKNLWKELKTK
jgi:Mlc titration factor MtfA (ptsG expression regulator)